MANTTLNFHFDYRHTSLCTRPDIDNFGHLLYNYKRKGKRKPVLMIDLNFAKQSSKFLELSF